MCFSQLVPFLALVVVVDVLVRGAARAGPGDGCITCLMIIWAAARGRVAAAVDM